MEAEKTDGGTHDMGFKLYNSVGNAYRLTHEQKYKDDIIQAAKTLITRFNPTIGCIKSWDNRKEWKFPVIIDNMMNLELLFEATKLSGDSSFYKVAVTHANTTLKNHFRPDNSSYHVIDYDPETGQVLHKQTTRVLPIARHGPAGKHGDFTVIPCATAKPVIKHTCRKPKR
jgi:unsaturated chondroitin disaccharide hydrolase